MSFENSDKKDDEVENFHAGEEEVVELGSEKFFKLMLGEELEGVDSVKVAKEMTKEIVIVLQEDLGGDFEKEKIFLKSVEALPEINSVEEYISAVAVVLEKAIHEKFTPEELEAVQRRAVLEHEEEGGPGIAGV